MLKLGRLLRQHDLHGSTIDTIERGDNPDVGVNMSEIVTCRMSSGEVIRLLCKYALGPSIAGEKAASIQTMELEAAVYSRVLVPLGIDTPTFFGLAKVGNVSWLVLE